MSAMLVYSKLPWTELATITIGFLISFVRTTRTYKLVIIRLILDFQDNRCDCVSPLVSSTLQVPRAILG